MKEVYEMEKEKRLRRRYLYGAATVAVMVLIFWFSHQPGEASSDISNGFLAWLMSGKVPFVSWFLETTKLFEWLPIRKCAHAAIYFVLGFLAAQTVATWELQTIPQMLSSWGTAVFYACTDEWHQAFIPGRECAFTDVLIDASGAFVGVLLVLILLKRKKRQEEQ